MLRHKFLCRDILSVVLLNLCCDNKILCRERVPSQHHVMVVATQNFYVATWPSCLAMLTFELYVMTYFENVVTYFLPRSCHSLKYLSQHKNLCRDQLDLTHLFKYVILCRDIVLLCRNILPSLFSSLFNDTGLNVLTKLYCHLL